MDETIRQLEREIAKTGDPRAILELDRNLRRTGLALSYYTTALITEFWKSFSLADFFTTRDGLRSRERQPRSFFVDLPDPTSSMPKDTTIGVFIQPGNELGWYPTLALTRASKSHFSNKSSKVYTLVRLYEWMTRESWPGRATGLAPGPDSLHEENLKQEINTYLTEAFAYLWNWQPWLTGPLPPEELHGR